ncbi:MAG: hypothetical protein PVH34_07625, partial [Syntrophobacterales bacterium]
RIQGEEVLITKGLEDGENVVTTPLKAVTDGMVVRVVGKPSAISSQLSAGSKQPRDKLGTDGQQAARQRGDKGIR